MFEHSDIFFLDNSFTGSVSISLECISFGIFYAKNGGNGLFYSAIGKCGIGVDVIKEAHLTATIHEQADELVHNACREMEALLLEQVSDRLKAELPTLVSRVILEHFRGPQRTN